MNVPRRTVLRGAAAASTAAVAGCSSFQRDEQVLLVENETDATREVTVTVRRAPEDGASTTTAGEDATTTAGTSQRFVVDFEYEVGANGRQEARQVLPKDGEYVVLADVPDVDTGRGTYEDTESVRVVVADDAVTVDTYRPE